MPVQLVLASGSPARLATLRAAGVEPRVRVSDVDEGRVVEQYAVSDPRDVALLLARAKAEAVASTWEEDGVVVGCDSILEIDGISYGKPADIDMARRWWRTVLRGATGVLHTGHWLVDLRADGSKATMGAVASTTIHFADPTDAEIEAYLATGEPTQVAGACTIDGYGGAFVRGIEGDPSNVIGISLPLLRELLAAMDVTWNELWAVAAAR